MKKITNIILSVVLLSSITAHAQYYGSGTTSSSSSSSSSSGAAFGGSNTISSGLGSSGDATANRGTPGAYTTVGRSNDIFVFCKYGIPRDGWIAVDPSVGSYQIISKYPNLQWIPTYVSICPQGGRSPGSWSGPGDGSETPFPH